MPFCFNTLTHTHVLRRGGSCSWRGQRANHAPGIEPVQQSQKTGFGAIQLPPQPLPPLLLLLPLYRVWFDLVPSHGLVRCVLTTRGGRGEGARRRLPRECVYALLRKAHVFIDTSGGMCRFYICQIFFSLGFTRIAWVAPLSCGTRVRMLRCIAGFVYRCM